MNGYMKTIFGLVGWIFLFWGMLGGAIAKVFGGLGMLFLIALDNGDDK